MGKLKFAHIEYSMSTTSLDIFTIGCGNGSTDPLKCACKGCCNPEIRDWNLDGLTSAQVLEKVEQLNFKFNKLITRILIVGGDPYDGYLRYPKEMISFLKNLKGALQKPVYLFTRHELVDIKIEIKEYCDFIKVGAYIPELITDNNIQYGIKLATSNQKIYKKGKDY